MKKIIRRLAMILFVPVMFLILLPFSLIIDGRRTALEDICEFFRNWNNYWNKED